MMRVARQQESGAACVWPQPADCFSIFRWIIPPHADATRTCGPRPHLGPHEKVSPSRRADCVLQFAFFWLPFECPKMATSEINGNLPARQEVQFVTRECVMILLHF